MLPREDLLLLRRPLATFAIALGLCLGALVWAGHQDARQRDLAHQRSATRDELVERIARSREALHIYRTGYARYRTLQRAGFIGEERRLYWIETVRETARQAGITPVEYRIDPRVPAAEVPPRPGLQVYRSRMHLDFQLRHEGELLAFLHRLQTAAAGILALRACDLKPLGEGPVRLDRPNLSAHCSLDWYTAQPVSHATAVEEGP